MKVIIVGGGQIGAHIASLLVENDHEVVIIDNREDIFSKLENEFSKEMLLLGSGTDPEVLKQAGIETVDVVAAVSGADEINLVVSTLAKMEFDVPRVVARINNPKNSWLFNNGMGVDVCVNQAELMAHLVVEEMNLKDMFTVLKLSRGTYSIVQFKVGKNAKAANLHLKDLSIPKQTVLIAITRNEKVLIPKGHTQIIVDDEILALTDEKSRHELNDLFA